MKKETKARKDRFVDDGSGVYVNGRPLKEVAAERKKAKEQKKGGK